MKLLAEQHWSKDIENGLMDTGAGEEGEGGMYGESNMETYMLLLLLSRFSSVRLCATP